MQSKLYTFISGIKVPKFCYVHHSLVYLVRLQVKPTI